MKGARAKKAAEEAAAATNGGMEPTPPSEPRSGPPRPGPIVGSTGFVQISEEKFKSLCNDIRANTLSGAAAADALEEAAGLKGPQGKAAAALRGDVANARSDEAKPKKKMGGFADQIDEIPDIEAKPKARASISEEQADARHDLESAENHPDKDAPEPPELSLTPKQNSMRTDLEMWVMDEIPVLYGVGDSDELAEDLQEDGQANMITFLIAEMNAEEHPKMVDNWLKDVPDAAAKAKFAEDIISKVGKIQALGPKKKKKKKPAE